MTGEQEGPTGTAVPSNKESQIPESVPFWDLAIGTPANDARFYDDSETVVVATTGRDGEYVPNISSIPSHKQGLHLVAEINPNNTNVENGGGALAQLDRMTSNRSVFLENLTGRMGLTLEKMKGVLAKVRKAVETYNNLESKDKLAVGLTMTSSGMVGAASGSTFLAGGIGLLHSTMKGSSTVTAYEGLAEILDKKYKELGDLPETGKKITQLGTPMTAILTNLVVTDTLNTSLNTETPENKLSQAIEMPSTPHVFGSEAPSTTPNEPIINTPEETFDKGNTVPSSDTHQSLGIGNDGTHPADTNLSPAMSEAIQSSEEHPISFTRNDSFSSEELLKLSIFDTIQASGQFESAITNAAKEIDKARSFFNFGDSSIHIKESFITMIRNNPSMSVHMLLSATMSGLSGQEALLLKEAQGILTRIIPEEALMTGDVQESVIVDILQNNFTA